MADATSYTLSNVTPTLIASGVGEVYIQAVAANLVYLGDSSVSTSTGYKVSLSGGEFRMHLGSTDEVWAVSSNNNDTIRVLRTR